MRRALPLALARDSWVESGSQHNMRVWFNVRMSAFPVEDAVFNSCHSLHLFSRPAALGGSFLRASVGLSCAPAGASSSLQSRFSDFAHLKGPESLNRDWNGLQA